MGDYLRYHPRLTESPMKTKRRTPCAANLLHTLAAVSSVGGVTQQPSSWGRHSHPKSAMIRGMFCWERFEGSHSLGALGATADPVLDLEDHSH